MSALLSFIKKHSLAVTLAICPLCLALFVNLTGRLSVRQLAEQERALNTSLERCIISCYALEGCYPPDLEYMEEHYGLTYNKQLFFVDYQPVAANIRPDYFVLRVTAAEQEHGRLYRK